MTDKGNDVITGNYFDKYGSKNPIVKRMMKGFHDALASIITELKGADRIVEVGCGEGKLTGFIGSLRPGAYIEGTDIGAEVVAAARRENPGIRFTVQNLLNGLEYEDESFDVVVACEVLEHLEDPGRALSEISRITRRYAILSVPNEPMWSFLNMVRGKYLLRLGNTPGHVQKWSKSGFVKMLEPAFTVRRVLTPTPWIMVLCEKRAE